MAMKILLSPSKTQKMTNKIGEPLLAPLFLKESKKLVEILNSLNDEELVKRLHIPKTQSEKVIAMYRHFGKESGSAIESYTGEAFKSLRGSWSTKHFIQAQSRLYIFSALYGLLRPLDNIHPYRLDMTMSILEKQSLTSFWKEHIHSVLIQEPLILSLASKEFEKIIDVPYMRVEFQNKQGKVVHTVLAKQMRGMMARYLIEHEINDYESMKTIEINQFTFLKQQDNILIFRQK